MPFKDIHGLDDYASEQPARGDNYLLAIGIDKYRHCPPLYNAVKDAKDLVALLKKRFNFDPSRITELYDAQATKHNIYKAFETFAEKVGPSDNFLVYFSGHGEYKKIFDSGYWIPAEAQRDAIDQFIPNSVIKTFLRAIKSHHTFLMVDSCFSGSVFREGASRSVTLRKERDPSRWGLTSGQNEIVADGKKGTNSPFAASILYQLENANEPLGVAALCDRVLEVVAANASQTPRGEPLNMGGHQGGQFVFHPTLSEESDWKEARAKNTQTAFRAYLKKHPSGQHITEAKSAILSLKSANAWKAIQKMPEEKPYEIEDKLYAILNFSNQYPNTELEHDVIESGEQLTHKKEFLEIYDNLFALKRFSKRKTSFKEKAKGRIKELEGDILQQHKERTTKKKTAPKSPASSKSNKRTVKKPGKASSGTSRKKRAEKTKIKPNPAASATKGPPPLKKQTPSPPWKQNIFKDPRDNQSYRTITLKDGKTWMTKNLNYAVGAGSWVHESLEYKKIFGRAYTFEAAQKACPKGWHIATDEEWKALANAYGGFRSVGILFGSDMGDPVNAYKALIRGGNAGFNASLGGRVFSNGNLDDVGKRGYYWTGTSYPESNHAWSYHFRANTQKIYRDIIERKNGLYVRCVKDWEFPKKS